MSNTPITFGSESVTVEPDVHKDATFKVTTGAGKTLKSWPISKGVATVDLGWNETGSKDEGEDPMETEITVTVTAENGYDDHDYTFSASRMNPVGFDLLASDFVVEAPAGSDVVAAFGQIDQFTVNVAEKADELTFTVELEDIEKQVLMVSMGGDEVEPSNRKRADRTDEQRYEVELDDGANTIDLMVTSEDDEEQSYQLIVRRDARSGDANLKALSLSDRHAEPSVQSGHYIVHGQCGERRYDRLRSRRRRIMTTPASPKARRTRSLLQCGPQPDHGDGHRRGRNHGGLHREGDARRAGSFVGCGSGCAEPERRRAAEPGVRPGHAGVHGQCGERLLIRGYRSRRRRIMVQRQRRPKPGEPGRS